MRCRLDRAKIKCACRIQFTLDVWQEQSVGEDQDESSDGDAGLRMAVRRRVPCGGAADGDPAADIRLTDKVEDRKA